MTQPPAESLSFVPEEPDAVVAEMDRLGAAHKGWINLLPEVREEDVPPPPVGLSTLLTGRVHDIPICTWVPGRQGRRGVEPDAVGIQHNGGTKIVRHLTEIGVPVPDGWRPEQDHPRRGLVLRVPVGVGHAEQLRWLLEAGSALSTVRLTGTWVAQIRSG